MPRKNADRKIVQLPKDYRTIMLEGASRELVAAQILLKNDFMVSMPVADDRYDLLIEKHPYYFRIQVKALDKDYIKDLNYPTSLDSWKISAYTTPKGKKKTYSADDADFIMGIELETSNYAVVPIDDVPNSGIIKLSEKTKRWPYFNTINAVYERIKNE